MEGGSQTNFSVLVSKLDAQGVHGSEDGSQALDGVAVDHRLVLLHVIPRKTIFVDNSACTYRYQTQAWTVPKKAQASICSH